MLRLASSWPISRTVLPTALHLATTSAYGTLSLIRSMHPCAMARFDRICSNMTCTRRAGLASATWPWLRMAWYCAALFCEYIMLSPLAGAGGAGAQAAGGVARSLIGARVELCIQISLGHFQCRHCRVHRIVLRGQGGRVRRQFRIQCSLLRRHVGQAGLQTLIDGREQSAGLR